MNVRQLKKALENCSDDAIVYIGNPNHAKSYQAAHEDIGVRYVVSQNEEVWFETYGNEDIETELEAIISVAIESAMSDNEVIDILFSQDEHGYTIDDIKKVNSSLYDFCMNNDYGKDTYY